MKLLPAILLAAVVLCLSACGESRDTEATPSQSSATQSAAQTQETASGDAAPARIGAEDTTEKKDEKSNAETDRQTVGGDNANSSQVNDGSSVQNSGDDAKTKTPEKSGSNSKPKQNQDHQKTEADSPEPTAAASKDPGERDNAEVSFNDL